jgi:hypothetical protein
MKLILIFPLMTMILAAADAPSPSAKPAAPPPSAKSALPTGIPAGAVEVSPGTYRLPDKQGKNWLYRVTPFGVARFEEKPEPAPAPIADSIRATEDGDMIRFERPSPFGTYRWQRKKSELSADERQAWERSRSQANQN